MRACNLKSKAQLHSPYAVCRACNPPYLSGCLRTHQRMMLQYWSCASLYRSWGNPECDQLLLLVPAVGNFKGQVCIVVFSISFHQQCISSPLSPSISTFIKRKQKYLPLSKGAGLIMALFPCLKPYSFPPRKDSYRCHYSLSLKEGPCTALQVCPVSSLFTLGRSESGPWSRPGCTEQCGYVCSA